MATDIRFTYPNGIQPARVDTATLAKRYLWDFDEKDCEKGCLYILDVLDDEIEMAHETPVRVTVDRSRPRSAVSA